MQPLLDLLPILLFFISFKIYGVYVSTAVMMIAALLQNAIYWFIHRRFEKLQLSILALILLLGALTLAFHNPLFIQWKPTIIYWLFALVFLGSRFIGQKLLLQHMLEASVQFPLPIWRQLNTLYSALFLGMGIANLYIAYHFSTNAWVNFKLFGALGFTVLITGILWFYITKYGTAIASNGAEKPVKNIPQ